MRALFCLVALSLLAGCQTNRIPIVPPQLAKIPASMRQACAGVVDIPARGLTEADITRLWGKDRARLGECARRHGSLAKAVTAIEN